MLRYLFTLLALLPGAAPALRAQTLLPPDFSCVVTEQRRDSLVWSNPANDCGTFLATEVHRADQPGGPYTLLDEVTDPAAESYAYDTDGTIFFYFLRYRFSCPTQPTVDSDTLRAGTLSVPRFRHVSVESGDLVLRWDASASVQADRYIVFENRGTNFAPLDTVFGTEYRIPGASAPAGPNPELAERSYLIVATDACGSDSPRSQLRSPARLDAAGGTGCSSDLTAAYADGDNGLGNEAVRAVETFVSVNGGPFASVGTAAEPLPFTGANDGDRVCLYTETIAAADSLRARSTVSCREVAISQPVRDIPLYGAGQRPGDVLYLAYGVPEPLPTGAVVTVEVVRQNGDVLTAAPAAGFDLGAGELLLPGLATELSPTDRVRLRVVDECEREVRTNEVIPVFLSGNTFPGGRNQLRWTPFRNGLDSAFATKVLRNDGRGAADFLALATVPTGSSFTDEEAGERTQCYRIVTCYRPPGSGAPLEFTSNDVCLTPEAGVYLPNAFNPRSARAENRTFRPFFGGAFAGEYSLQVYDRWGGLRFSSSDPATGWDGTVAGQRAPSGVYLYVLRLTGADGVARQRSGTVNLVY